MVFIPFTQVNALGEWFDPIHVEVEQNSLDSSLQDSKLQRQLLNASMNRSVVQNQNCTRTYNDIQNYKSSILSMDTANPIIAERAQQYLEFLYTQHNQCISSQSQYYNSSNSNNSNDTSTTCPRGFLSNGDGTCSIDKNYSQVETVNLVEQENESCKNTFGVHSIRSRQLDDNGHPTCVCEDGYEWGVNDTCILIPIIDNDAICKNNYGKNSYWTANIDSMGVVECDCYLNFQWNEAKDTCIPIKNEGEVIKDVPKEVLQEVVTMPEEVNTLTDIKLKEDDVATVIESVDNNSDINVNKIEEEKSGYGFIGDLFNWIFSLFK